MYAFSIFTRVMAFYIPTQTNEEPYIPIIMKRIRNEEEVLAKGLPGYAEYKSKVKYRLFPFLW